MHEPPEKQPTQSEAASEAHPTPASPAPTPMFVPPQQGEKITSSVTGSTYTIGRLLGEGSFGFVYEGTDTWENELEIKVLKPLDSYEQVRAAAARELERLFELRHPNVVFVFDAFEYRYTFYIVCDRCWKPINRLVEETPDFNGSVWLRPIARQLLQAVHFLHVNRYVHQDIRAGNVLIDAQRDELDEGRIVFTFMLADLGITKLVSEIDPANTVLAQWMRAPEAIASDQFGPMDQRMDLYHCALLFLHVLQGKPLTFTQEQVLAGEPKRMAREIGGRYADALERALRRHAQHRTPTAIDFWRDIQAAHRL